MPDLKFGGKIFLFFYFVFLPVALEGETLDDRLKGEVEFLCDSLRAGRATGSAGGSDAAFFIYGRFRDAGLDVSVQCFPVSDSLAGHNVMGEIHSSEYGRYIVVTAYYDGLGVQDGRHYPGADSNASGTAALLELASRTASCQGLRKNVLFVALDAHNCSRAGSEALWNYLSERKISRSRIEVVINIDILGGTLSPVERYWKDYLIALGGLRYSNSLDTCGYDTGIHMYYDYYGSRRFTDLFYRKLGDQSVFVRHGVPAVMFTSGITMNTNKLDDLPETLNWMVLERRVTMIGDWLEKLAK